MQIIDVKRLGGIGGSKKGFVAVLLVWVALFPLAASGMIPPEQLQGQWKDQDGKIYQIEVESQRAQVSLKVPFAQGQVKTYVGHYNPSNFQMTFTPGNVTQIASDIPLKVRNEILRQGHVFTGQLKIVSPLQLEFTERIDQVRYATSDNTFQEIQKGPAVRVIRLQKPDAYTIKAIDVLLNHYQTRRDGEIRELQQKVEQLATQDLPELAGLLHSAEQRYDHREKQRDGLVKEREKKGQERKTLEQEILQLRNNRPEGFRELDNRRASLLQNIHTVEDTILSNRENPEFEAPQAFASLDAMKAELAALNRQINKQYPDERSVTEVEQLTRKIERYFQELERLDTHILEQSRLLNEEASTLEERQAEYDAKAAELAESRQQLQDLINQPVPFILEARLRAAGQPKFFAKLYRDDAYVQRLEDEIATLEQQLQENKARDKELTDLLAEAKPAKQEAFENFVALTEKTIQSGNRLHSRLLISMAGKATTEFLATGAEIVWAAKEGGMFGALKETGVIIAQHVLGIDDVGFDMYDESALRKEIFAGGTQVESVLQGHAKDFLEDQITKTPFNIGLGAIDHIFEVQKTSMQEHQKLSEISKELAEDRRYANRVQKALEKETERLTDADKRLRNSLDKTKRSLDSGNLSNALSDHANYKTAQQDMAQARKDFKKLAHEHDVSKNYLKKGKNSIEKANQRISDLYSGKNAVKGTGKSLLPGLAADTLKEIPNIALDKVEEAAWRELLSNELAQRLAYIQYQRAANYYWRIWDLREDIREADNEMKHLKTEKKHQLQANIASIQAGGFHILENQPFNSQDTPLELELSVVSPHGNEGTYLESPDKNSQLKVIPGLSVSNSKSSPDAGLFPAVSQLKRRYQMDASKLPLLLRDGGELNLVIIPF